MNSRRLLALLLLDLLLILSFPPASPLVRAEPPAADDPLSWLESPKQAVFAKATAEVKAQFEALRRMLVRLQDERLRLQKDSAHLRQMLLTARRENEALKQRLADQESRFERVEARLTGTLMRQLLDRVAAAEADSKRRLAATEAESRQRLQTAEAAQKKSLARMYLWAGQQEEGRSEDRAILWFQRACQAGETDGCLRVWQIGLAQVKRLEAYSTRWEAADQWYASACRGSFAEGCTWRKQAWFLRGESLKGRNWKQAVVWYQKACAEGHTEACNAKEKPVYVAGQRREVEHLPQGYAVYIPAGSFVMGSPDDEKQRSSDEGPQRTVTLTHGGWMLETEVTQGQFQALMGYNKSHFSSCGERCPVENVSWHEAAAFAKALSAKQGKDGCFTCTGSEQTLECRAKNLREYVACQGWRLPTEAEWEYAARAGTTTRFHTGDCITTDQANFDGNRPAEGCPRGEERNKTIAVGSLAKNAWGLFDMHGNVWEWVYDLQGRSTGFATENPTGNSSASVRILRGGSWYDDGRYLRAALRYRYSPADRAHNLGFRLFLQEP